MTNFTFWRCKLWKS